ncbi:AI-2E family transporter [Clostridium sp.]|uniref:AI-2E family transporter n=1 Tax=Clostridium sp. TaxID=1506 RepID=UPI002590B97C|nr:AI-2E family transporter [Clostridium sp.]MDF2502550.1 putative permease [Clostridium sp.]
MYEKYKKIINCITILLIFIVATIIIKNYFKPFFIIIGLLIFSTPIYNFMYKHKIFNKRLNAIIAIMIINILFFISVIYSGNFIIEKLRYLVANVFNNFTLDDLDSKIQGTKYFRIEEIIERAKYSIFDNIDSKIIQRGASYTTDSILSYFVSNISVYFILVDKYVIVKSTERLITKEKVTLIHKKIQDIKKMISIEAILVLLTTIQTVFGFVILEINSAIFLGILCGALDILPYVGTILIFLPLIIYKVYLRQYIIAVGLIFLYTLLQFNRQIMETKFMSTKLQIHPLLLILSMYIGGKVFGIVGIIIAPIYVLTIKEIIL